MKAFVGYIINKGANFPIVGHLETTDGSYYEKSAWKENGMAREDFRHDLIEEWKEPKSGIGYLHVYIDDGEIEYRFRDNNNNLENLANAIVRVEWNEGQFDE